MKHKHTIEASHKQLCLDELQAACASNPLTIHSLLTEGLITVIMSTHIGGVRTAEGGSGVGATPGFPAPAALCGTAAQPGYNF